MKNLKKFDIIYIENQKKERLDNMEYQKGKEMQVQYFLVADWEEPSPYKGEKCSVIFSANYSEFDNQFYNFEYHPIDSLSIDNITDSVWLSYPTITHNDFMDMSDVLQFLKQAEKETEQHFNNPRFVKVVYYIESKIESTTKAEDFFK